MISAASIEPNLSLTHNLDRPILEISGFRYVDPGTAPGLNCLAMNVGQSRCNPTVIAINSPLEVYVNHLQKNLHV